MTLKKCFQKANHTNATNIAERKPIGKMFVVMFTANEKLHSKSLSNNHDITFDKNN